MLLRHRDCWQLLEAESFRQRLQCQARTSGGSGPDDELELCIQGKVYVPELRLLVAFARVRMMSPMFFIVSAILSRCEGGRIEGGEAFGST